MYFVCWVNRLRDEKSIRTLLNLPHIKFENPKRKITMDAELIVVLTEDNKNMAEVINILEQ